MLKTISVLFSQFLATIGFASSRELLCFQSESDNAVVSVISQGESHPQILYSDDNKKTWKELSSGGKITFKGTGEKIYLKGDNPQGFSVGEKDYTKFVIEGKISASGNIMSLVYGKGSSKKIPNDYCFYQLFAYCQGLVSAPELPSKGLTKRCYSNMFCGCSQLKEAPQLPAKKMEEGCYRGMFEACKGIEKAPELPAKKLMDKCYSNMFRDCKGLISAPALPAKKLYD